VSFTFLTLRRNTGILNYLVMVVYELQDEKKKLVSPLLVEFFSTIAFSGHQTGCLC